MWLLPRMLSCVPKDEVLFMSLKEHSEPLAENCSWMSSLTKFGKRIGAFPVFKTHAIDQLEFA